MDDFDKSINDRVKSVRERLNMSQRDFGKELGVRQSYYSEVETGRRKVGARMIERLREKYSVSGDWLSTGKGDNYITITDYNSPHTSVPLLSPNEKERKEIDNRSAFQNMWKFRLLLSDKYPEYDKILRDVFRIFEAKELIDDFQNSTIGNAAYFSHSIPNNVSFKEFKEIGFQSIEAIKPYNELIERFANAVTAFAIELEMIKEEINLDFDFEDFDPEATKEKLREFLKHTEMRSNELNEGFIQT